MRIKTNMRIGPLVYKKPGSTYDDLVTVLGSRTTKVDTFNIAFNVLSNISQCDDIPDSISLDADQLAVSIISPADLIVAIQTLQKLNIEKFNSTRHHTINVTAGQPISAELADTFANYGITSILPKISVYGFDACVSANRESELHGGHWPSYLIDNTRTSVVYPTVVPITLTRRQQEIADLITHRGLSNKQIARHCGISESAVKLHIGIVLKKYGVQNRTQIGIARK